MSKVLFEETQKFRQLWLWALLLGAGGYSIWATADQHGLSSQDSIIVISIIAVLIALLLIIKLKTSIRENGIKIKFSPFISRTIKWKDIKSLRVKEYSALREYGGWGIRFGINKTAYNIRGNEGLEIILQNAKKVMVGTQQADKLREAIGRVSLAPTKN